MVLHHLFTFRNYYFPGDAFEIPVIGLIGYYGIQFFFAGSGFLITYLLLAEREKHGSVSLKDFYVRRILRIWPAYYVLIILALLICLQQPFFRIPEITDNYLAADHYKANRLYLFFLPHLAGQYYPTAPYVHPTYTIGIEEQFYFVWGILFIVAARYLRWVFMAMIVGIFALTCWQQWGGDNVANRPGWFSNVILYLKYCRFSTFAIGALWAWSYHAGHAWLQVFKKPVIQLLVYAWLILSVAFDLSIPCFRDEYISVVTLSLFTVASFTKESLVSYDAPWLRYLGKISYGIYLFHIFAIVFSLKLTGYLFGEASSVNSLVFLVLTTLILSIGFGWISYHTVEKFFLAIKKKFARVDHA